MFDRIIRVGDRVRMNMGQEARDYGRKGVPDGTEGTVTGRLRVTDYIENRYPAPYGGKEPGIYAFDGVPFVAWDKYPEGVDPSDESYNRVNSMDLEPASSFQEEYDLRYKTEWPVRNADGSYNTNFDSTAADIKLLNTERVGDLPETPFWELDIVSWCDRRYQIRRINYNGWGPEGRHCYSMEEVDENNVYLGSGSLSVEPDELQLICRGNLYLEAHGVEKVFHSLEEETRFETAMGRYKEVRNPANNLYLWTLEEVLQAIKDDIVDGFTNGTMLFSSTRKISANRFTNRDIGERVRQETLKGFEIDA